MFYHLKIFHCSGRRLSINEKGEDHWKELKPDVLNVSQ